MHISHAVFVTGASALLSLAGACTHAVGEAPGSGTQDEQANASVRLPAFPEEAVLCDIVYNESTPADVAAVLGEPGDTTDAGTGSDNFFYDFDQGASLFIGFQHGVFVDAMVANAPYPSCWSAEKQALSAGLQDLRSMSMSNESNVPNAQGGAR